MGIFALLFMLLPSYTLFLEIPTGILAIRFGRRAMSKCTRKTKLALAGQLLGWMVLTSLALEILLAVTLIVIGMFYY